MALVISLRAGQAFYIDNERFTVTHVFTETHFRVVREHTHEAFEITEQERSEVLPDVFIFGGKRLGPPTALLKIDAPQDIAIRRGKSASLTGKR